MTSAHQESSNALSLLSSVYRKTRVAFLSAIIFGLVATNIATLMSDAFHNNLYGALSRLVSALPNFAGKHKLLQKSPTSVRQVAVRNATQKLQAEKSALIKKNRDLTQRHNSLVTRYNGLATNHNTLRNQHLATRRAYSDLQKTTRIRSDKLQAFSARMSSRSAKVAAANLAALPAEFVPAFGTAAIISLTALDVYLLCEGMNELNSVKETFGLSKEDDTKVCGIKVPDKKTVLAELGNNYDKTISKAKEYIKWDD